MPSNLLFLIAIGAILVVNLTVVAAAAHRDGRPWLPDRAARWLRARSAVGRAVWRPVGSSVAPVAGRPGNGPARPTGPDNLGPDEDRSRTAAAIEAFVIGLDGRVGGQAPVPEPAPSTPSEFAVPMLVRLADGRPGDPRPGNGESPQLDRGDPATWDRLLREEAARVARFGRPATVVFVECPGLDRVAQRLGAAAADRVAAELARLMLVEGRATDRVVRLGSARFGALLVETDELAAGRYVERIRAAGDDWLAAAGLVTRLEVGWASPGNGRDLGLAAEAARDRMGARDRQRDAPGRTRVSRAPQRTASELNAPIGSITAP